LQVGLITVDGRAVGFIALEGGTNPQPDNVTQASPLLQNAAFMTDDGLSASRNLPGYGGHRTARGQDGTGHGGDRYTGRQVEGSASPVGGDRVYGGFAEARDRARAELKANPDLNEKAMHIFAGENPDPDASTALWEETINRMAVRGTSLEKELRTTREGGYYEGWRDEVSPSTRKTLEASRDRALNYSNVSNYATDNSSGDLARRDRESGHFTEKQVLNREHFFGPDNRIDAHQKAYNKLVAESEAQRAASAPAAAASATNQPGPIEGVDPKAFIMHHTGGRGTPEGVENTLRQRGLGVQYIMDREGNITRAGGPGSAQMLPGWGPKGEGLDNRNTVGMEVIANDDKDVTPAQVAAAKAFIARNYPNTPVFGHGEVNPGHKEVDEGMTIVNAIRADRAAKPQAKNFDPETMAP
jgi:hypothetical protein